MYYTLSAIRLGKTYLSDYGNLEEKYEKSFRANFRGVSCAVSSSPILSNSAVFENCGTEFL